MLFTITRTWASHPALRVTVFQLYIKTWLKFHNSEYHLQKKEEHKWSIFCKFEFYIFVHQAIFSMRYVIGPKVILLYDHDPEETTWNGFLISH